MTPEHETDTGRNRFRGILVRVLAVQAAALLLLWLLQLRYSAG